MVKSTLVKVFSVAVGLAGIMLALVLFGALPVELTRSGVTSASEARDPKWNTAWNNIELITLMTSLYINVEKRAPATYEELARSRYMAVRAQDIINPYTLQPVRVVTSPSAGDITWSYNAPELTIGMYFEKNGALQYSTHKYDSAFIERVISYGDFSQNGASENEIRVAYSSDIFLQLVKNVLLRYDSTYGDRSRVPWPTTFDEFVADQEYLAKFYNPYTGGYMQNVPPTQPSPGNFSFEVTIEDGIVQMYSISFYGDNGNLMFEANIPPAPSEG